MNDISYWVSTRCKLIKLDKLTIVKFSHMHVICCAVESTCKSKKAASSRHSDLTIVLWSGPTNTNPRTSASELGQPVWASVSLRGTLLSRTAITALAVLLFVLNPRQPDPCPAGAFSKA